MISNGGSAEVLLNSPHIFLFEKGIARPPLADSQTNHEPTKWYGILVRTTPVHNYGSVVWGVRNSKQLPQPIPWQSYDTSAIEPMSSSLVADTHLSLCLIDEVTWESQNTILAKKLARGLYWDIRGQDSWYRGARWTEEQVLAILGIEVLGILGVKHDFIDTCHQCERHQTPFPGRVICCGAVGD